MGQKSRLQLNLEHSWQRMEKILRSKGFNTVLIDSERSLRKFIYDTIPDNSIVGLGASVSKRALKIRDILLEKGNKVYLNWNGSAYNRSMDSFDEKPRPEFFLTLTDSITEDGSVLSEDYSPDAANIYDLPEHIIGIFILKNGVTHADYRGFSSNQTVLSNRTKTFKLTIALMHA